MAKLAKAQIERAWKKDLGNSGFVSEKGGFTREKPGTIREVIAVQRNAWQPTFKVLIQICLF